jgi:hypothetical protein
MPYICDTKRKASTRIVLSIQHINDGRSRLLPRCTSVDDTRDIGVYIPAHVHGTYGVDDDDCIVTDRCDSFDLPPEVRRQKSLEWIGDEPSYRLSTIDPNRFCPLDYRRRYRKTQVRHSSCRIWSFLYLYPKIEETHALANTNATSFPWAALTPASRSFDNDEVIVADAPTNEVIASIGGTINCNEFEPEPHLHLQ